ncbi:unnamed protein product [Calypogeia fissa]
MTTQVGARVIGRGLLPQWNRKVYVKMASTALLFSALQPLAYTRRAGATCRARADDEGESFQLAPFTPMRVHRPVRGLCCWHRALGDQNVQMEALCTSSAAPTRNLLQWIRIP